MKSYFISATFTDHIGIGFLMIFGHCYRQRDGLRVAPAIAADTVLPDYEHVNLQAFGDRDPQDLCGTTTISTKGPIILTPILRPKLRVLPLLKPLNHHLLKRIILLV